MLLRQRACLVLSFVASFLSIHVFAQSKPQALGFDTLRFEEGPGISRISDSEYNSSVSGLVFQFHRAGAAVDVQSTEASSTQVIHLDLAGGCRRPRITPQGLLPGISSYFPGPDVRTWRTNLRSWSALRYDGVYPGIDLIYYGNRGQLEYDFIVAPNGDPVHIAIRLSKNAHATLDDNGGLTITGPSERLRFAKPMIYQLAEDGSRNLIAGGYVLKGQNHLGFKVEQWDHSRPLIIDPILSWATFVGASNIESLTSIAVDPTGNTYLAGRSGGLLLVEKLSPDGTTLTYRAVLGSSYTATVEDIKVNSSGQAYVVGTSGPGFPTTAGAFKSKVTSGSHAFFAVLNSAGTALTYGTYLAGTTSAGDQGNSVAVDSLGKAYVTGSTNSSTFPTTAGAFQTTLSSSGQAGFVAKIDPTLSGTSSLVYSTYIGGPTTSTSEIGVAVDSSGDAYVSGTAGLDFPTTTGTFQYNGVGLGQGGVYVSKLNATGTALSYSAYLGPGQANGIAVDGSGDAYITGTVAVSDFPTTTGAYLTTFPQGFVTELNPAGTALVYSTFLSGPSENANPTSIAIEPGCASACNVFVSGFTGANDFPTTNPIQGFNASFVASSTGNDDFITQLNGTGSAAVYSTYLGGSNDESNPSTAHTPEIAVTAAGDAYVAGVTSSVDFPVTLTATPARPSFAVKIGATAGATAVVFPTSLSFSSQPIPVPSATQSVTLRNMGSTAMTISGIVISGDYTESNTCGSALVGGASCVITVTFTPSAAGSRTGKITITQSGNNSPTVVNLTGTGVAASFVTLTPSTLTFADQNVGTASPSQTVTVGNIGNQNLTFPTGAFSTVGPFAETNNCPASLATKTTCTVNVAFLPTQVGILTGNLNVSSNSSPLASSSVSLSGTGFAGSAALTLSTAGLIFNPQVLNTTSFGQFVTVTNTGNTVVDIYGLTVSGDYAATGCVLALNPGASCGVRVTFTPTVAGTRTGAVTLADSTPAGTHSLSLTGTGVTPTATLSIDPPSLSFPDTTVGATSGNVTIQVTNTSDFNVTIDRVFESGDFRVASSGCVTILRPGSTCGILVQFVPSTTGTRTGSITLADAATGNPQRVTLSGNGIAAAAVATVSPEGLNFQTQAQSTTSNPLNVTLFNIGNLSFDASKVSASGDYQIFSNGCAAVLTVGRTCTVQVTFTPTATGTRSGALTFTNVAGTQTVNLSGSGVAETLALGFTPAAMTFQAQQKSVASPLQFLWIRNAGTAAVTVSNIASNNPDYTPNGACVGTIQPNTSCQIGVTFAPSVTGADNHTLTITSNGTGSPQTVTLNGSGVATAPTITLNPSGLAYNNQVVGTTSSIQFVTVSNTTGSAVNALSFAHTGDFTIPSNSCTATLNASSSCSFQVTFTPTVAGARTGTVTVSYTGGTQVLNLAGFGVTSSVSALLVDTALTFPSQTTGVTSNSESITFSNTGNTPFSITSIALGGTNPGDFAVSNSCPLTPSQFNAFSNCNINVTFTPTATGPRSATITITDGAPGSPRTVNLSGKGIAPVQALEIDPPSLVFPDTVNTTNSSINPSVILTNTGTSPVTISSITLGGVNSGDFAISNSCPAPGTLPPGAFGNSCTVMVTFKPTATGGRNATLTIAHSAPGSPKVISLSGSGVTPAKTLAVTPTTLVFNPQVTGTTSAQQTITVTNVGNFTVTFTNVTVTTNYALSNGCVGQLAPGNPCTIGITFTPTKTGTITGTVTITDDATGSPQKVALSGTGISTSQEISLSQTSMFFDAQTVSTPSPAQSLYYSNHGNTAVTISSVTITGTEFVQNHGCDSAQVFPGGFCTIRITFTPSAAGTRTATLAIIDNAPGGSSPGRQVSLSGIGITSAVPEVTLTPASLTFASQAAGTTSAAQNINLSNTGTTTLTISSIAVTGTNSGDFSQTNNCSSKLAAGFSCNIAVTFSPLAVGSRSAAITITDNASGGPQSVTLSGTGKVGALPVVTLTPATLAFPNVQLNTASAPQVVTVKNTGAAALNITNISISATVSGDFSQVNTCSSSIPVGSTCTITVTFTPTSLINQTGSVSITDNAATTLQSVPLTGNAVFAAVFISSTSLTFASQKVGTTSAAQNITLENYGNFPLSIKGVVVSSDYLVASNSCGSSLGVGLKCTIGIEFKPSATGSRPGTLMITDNAGDSPQVIELSGTGTP